MFEAGIPLLGLAPMLGAPRTVDVALAGPVGFLLAVLVSVGVGLVVGRLERRATTTRDEAALDRLAVTASGF
jgi:hypothetical protein